MILPTPRCDVGFEKSFLLKLIFRTDATHGCSPVILLINFIPRVWNEYAAFLKVSISKDCHFLLECNNGV